MPSSFPKFRLYASNGVTLIYEFELVTNIDGDFTDPEGFIEHDGFRGQGSIPVQGSQRAFDITLTFLLRGTGDTAALKYEDLVTQMDALNTTIAKFTKYVLKIDKSPSTTKDYKVQRLETITWPLNNNTKRVNYQTGVIILKANTWA